MVEDLSHRADLSVSLCCETLEVSRGGYYAWQSRPVSERGTEDQVILSRIRAIHEKTKQTYSSPRMTAELQAEGFWCNEKRVARIMRENKIVSEAVKKFKIATTDSNHDLPIAERLFKTEDVENVWAPNQFFVGDITYIHTEEGFLFLAIFLDIFTRKIVGYGAENHMRADLILDALGMALRQQEVKPGETIAHSDQGLQYAADEYKRKLDLVGIVASMSRKGNCWDNAHCESFFHSLKMEGSIAQTSKPEKKQSGRSFRGLKPGTIGKDVTRLLSTCRQLNMKN